MTTKTQTTLKRLKTLAKNWPSNLVLVVLGDTLAVTKPDGEIVEFVPGITVHGDDPGTRVKGKKEYVRGMG